jgi:hypothetical protein
VRGNNARGVFGRDDELAIEWRNGEQSYEAVFGPHRDPSADRSLAPFLKQNVASPEMTERAVEEWRRGP